MGEKEQLVMEGVFFSVSRGKRGKGELNLSGEGEGSGIAYGRIRGFRTVWEKRRR